MFEMRPHSSFSLLLLYCLGIIIFGRANQIEDVSTFLQAELVGTSDFQEQEISENTKVQFENSMLIFERSGEILDLVDVKTDPLAKFAGCDGIDQEFTQNSDTNEADNCEEDKFPPELLLLSPLPIVDPPSKDFFRLEKTFSKEAEAIAYLKSVTQVIDDCSRPSLLSSEVELVGGSCIDTEFEITPKQEQCEGVDFFLRGSTTKVILDVDEEAPLASCGFRQTVLESSSKGSKGKGSKDKKGSKRNLGSKNKDKGSKKKQKKKQKQKKGSSGLSRFVDGKTLFIREVGAKGSSLVDTEFFFEIEVR
jgi:hypothetical protein